MAQAVGPLAFGASPGVPAAGLGQGLGPAMAGVLAATALPGRARAVECHWQGLGRGWLGHGKGAAGYCGAGLLCWVVGATRYVTGCRLSGWVPWRVGLGSSLW